MHMAAAGTDCGAHKAVRPDMIQIKRSGRKVKPLDPVCMLPLGGFPIRINVWHCW